MQMGRAASTKIGHRVPRRARAVLLLSLGATGAGALSASASVSAGSVLDRSMRAAVASTSVQYKTSASLSSVAVTEVGIVGRSSGQLSISYATGSSVAHGTITLLAGKIYVSAERPVLAGLLGFSPAASLAMSGHAFFTPASTKEGNVLAAGLTLSSVLDEVHLSGQVHYGAARTVAGTRALGLVGTTAAVDGAPATPETLYVAASGAPLPIEAAQFSKDATATIVFSKWGIAVSPKAPVHPVAFNSAWTGS
jgi:hypothetical protein